MEVDSQRLAKAANQVLRMNSAGANAPEWATISSMLKLNKLK